MNLNQVFALCSLFFALRSWLRWLYTKMKRIYDVRCTMYNFRSRLPLFAPPLHRPLSLLSDTVNISH